MERKNAPEIPVLSELLSRPCPRFSAFLPHTHFLLGTTRRPLRRLTGPGAPQLRLHVRDQALMPLLMGGQRVPPAS